MSFKLAFAISNRGAKEALWVFVVLAVMLAWFFRDTYAPGHVAFSNDGPLGRLMTPSHRLPDAFTGVWQDLNTVGYREGGALPNITFGIRGLLGPLLFAKSYPVLALLVLGMGAWCFFRQLDLAPLACFLGSLAATLNSSFFSAACWGVGSHAITIGLTFFALSAVAGSTGRTRWLRLALAGCAVGLGVSEGADIGAMFSLYVAGFVIYQAWIDEGPNTKKLALGIGRVAALGLPALLLAAQPLAVLVETQIKGVSGGQQIAPNGEDRWYWATKWSLPKREALGLLIPGLFGYRVDSPQGMQYWGAAGRDADWQRYFDAGATGETPRGVIRFTGGGNYTGVLVILIGLWAAAQSLRKQNSVFPASERRWLWFWSGQAVLSLLLALGKYAPFYRLIYVLPLASTVRNPAKFIHPVNFALVVLFAYGVHGLCKFWLEKPESGSTAVPQNLGSWWNAMRGFDRRWTIACLVAIVLSGVGWFVYSGNSEGLQNYLHEVRFDPATANAIAKFSIASVGWFALALTAAVFLVLLILSGRLGGKRAGWAGLLLTFFVLGDLGKANQPWIIAWDYKDKYASNPIIDILRVDTNQHRVAVLPFLSGNRDAPFDRLYHVEWAQHQFPFYNIQSLDIVQMPRTPVDLAAFDNALQFDWTSNTVHHLARRWQLTNTRYLLGAAVLLHVLNRDIDPVQHRFEIVARFNLAPRVPGAGPMESEKFNAVQAADGQYALFQFKGALPRARLYANWQIEPDASLALNKLVDTSFDPETSVLVSSVLPAVGPAKGAASAGTVQFESYSPKNLRLRAVGTVPSVLLLNDRFDPNWVALVDGKKAPLLRCNYVMRGVYLEPGTHLIEFHFLPPVGPLYVSLAAIAGCVMLLGLLGLSTVQKPSLQQSTVPEIPEHTRTKDVKLRST